MPKPDHSGSRTASGTALSLLSYYQNEMDDSIISTLTAIWYKTARTNQKRLTIKSGITSGINHVYGIKSLVQNREKRVLGERGDLIETLGARVDKSCLRIGEELGGAVVA